jgi:hypothetical protein
LKEKYPNTPHLQHYGEWFGLADINWYLKAISTVNPDCFIFHKSWNGEENWVDRAGEEFINDEDGFWNGLPLKTLMSSGKRKKFCMEADCVRNEKGELVTLNQFRAEKRASKKKSSKVLNLTKMTAQDLDEEMNLSDTSSSKSHQMMAQKQ